MRVWESFGWVNAQSLARDRWQQSPMPTCKGKTERDQIWLSPQLAALCNQVQVLPTFADHATVKVGFSTKQRQPTSPKDSVLPPLDPGRQPLSGCHHLQS